MPDSISVLVNGHVIVVPIGAVVSVALLIADTPCRISVDGQPRTAVCGMGICFECRATVDGVPHIRTCQLACQPGMTVETQR
jgi:sarcosine oxidase subunit alpha